MGSWWFLLLGPHGTELVGYFPSEDECDKYQKEMEDRLPHYDCLPCVNEEEDE